MKRLAQVDQLIKCVTEDTGEHYIVGSGDLHLEFAFNELQNNYAKCELKKTELIVIYKETVSEHSNQICMAKSPNKHNRIYIQAQPLGDDLTVEIEKEMINARQEPKERVKKLMERHDWT